MKRPFRRVLSVRGLCIAFYRAGIVMNIARVICHNPGDYLILINFFFYIYNLIYYFSRLSIIEMNLDIENN